MWHTYYPVKGAYTPAAAPWNHTIEGLHERAVPAPTATGAYLLGRAAPSGTGVYHPRRAVASGSGFLAVRAVAPTGIAAASGYLAGRAAPTGYSVVSWNETQS